MKKNDLSKKNLSGTNISVVLGNHQALENVNIDANPGEVIGIVGQNGSGKTTLLQTICGLLDPITGEVRVNNIPVASLNPSHRATLISYMPQSQVIHPFRVEEFVLMGRYPYLRRFTTESDFDKDIAYQAMKKTLTLELAARQISTLSGGEIQRVALARVFAQSSKVMVLDEPTSNLDLHHQLLMMETLKKEVTSRNASAIMVMHDLSIAARYCDRIFLMFLGKIIASGKPITVLTTENLRQAFNIEAIVDINPVSGQPSIITLGALGQNENSISDHSSKLIHLVCGAGSGRDLMHQLKIAGYRITVGVLGKGDTDYETAISLGIPHISAQPFSPITRKQNDEHRAQIKSADIVVLCDMDVNPNNLANLESMELAENIIVTQKDPKIIWDYTDGIATSIRERLISKGAEIDANQILRSIAEDSRS